MKIREFYINSSASDQIGEHHLRVLDQILKFSGQAEELGKILKLNHMQCTVKRLQKYMLQTLVEHFAFSLL
jgi:hypothetical protein